MGEIIPKWSDGCRRAVSISMDGNAAYVGEAYSQCTRCGSRQNRPSADMLHCPSCGWDGHRIIFRENATNETKKSLLARLVEFFFRVEE